MELVILLHSISDSRGGNMMLVTVEVSQGIVQIAECGSGVASILCKINKVEKCTHCLHDPFGNTLVACDNRDKNAL